MTTYNATDKKILEMLKQYEGQTVGDLLDSDLAEIIGLDVIKIDGHAIGWGDDYDASIEGLVIRYIQVHNVNGYIIADIATEDF